MGSSGGNEGARRPRVAVLGSLVFDLAIQLDRMPATHETVLARGVHVSCGGKGLSQAVAAARLGAEVDVIGRVGEDVFGDAVLATLDRHGINRTRVKTDPAGTHIGIPIITPDGNNRIIGVPRASDRVSVEDIVEAGSSIANADVLVVQCETPLPAVSAAITLAGRSGTRVIWNPAPAVYPLNQLVAAPHGPLVSWFTPNETEAAMLAGVPVASPDEAIHAARLIRQAAGGNAGVIVTLGAQGAVAVDDKGQEHASPPIPVDAIDPTGAGDAYTGAFATAIAMRMPLATAMLVASAAGALTATRVGAADAIPARDEVLALMKSSGYPA